MRKEVWQRSKCECYLWVLGVVGLMGVGVEAMEKRSSGYFGIPVPGQSASALDIFNLFSNNCKRVPGNYNSRDLVQDSINMLSGTNGASLAQQIYNNLYFSLGEVDIEAVMGRWFRVLDSTSIQSTKCVVSYYKLVHSSTYLASFTTKDYFRREEGVGIINGYGNKVGPDPGQLLIHTGHPVDRCPYSLVKTGPLGRNGQYEYLVLTQFLKHPLIILARNPREFHLHHKKDVQAFLRTHNFENPLTRTYNMINFIDWAKCPEEFYFSLNQNR